MNKGELAAVEIMEIALKLKRNGHDCFVDYSPHVQNIYVKLFVGGWIRKEENGGVHMIEHLRIVCELPDCEKALHQLMVFVTEHGLNISKADQTEQKIKFQNENNN